jgi:hypothetical protein
VWRKVPTATTYSRIPKHFHPIETSIDTKSDVPRQFKRHHWPPARLPEHFGHHAKAWTRDIRRIDVRSTYAFVSISDTGTLSESLMNSSPVPRAAERNIDPLAVACKQSVPSSSVQGCIECEALQMERIHHHVTEKALVKAKAALETCQQELHMVRRSLRPQNLIRTTRPSTNK